MNPNAKKWIRALRSGKYKQGKDRLATVRKTYCCLGVACELAVKAGIVQRFEIETGEGVALAYGNRRKEALALPKTVKDWLGLSTSNGDYRQSATVASSLTEQNDYKQKNFAQIADIIASEPKGLFKKVRAKAAGR